MVAGEGNDLDPAATAHGPLDGLVKADRAAVEQAIELGVGHGTALAHGGGEFGDAGDPVVDRARRHAQQTRKLREAGAPPTMVARPSAQFGAVERGTPTAMLAAGHGYYISTAVPQVNNYITKVLSAVSTNLMLAGSLEFLPTMGACNVSDAGSAGGAGSTRRAARRTPTECLICAVNDIY
jgi:hypothetical protein